MLSNIAKAIQNLGQIAHPDPKFMSGHAFCGDRTGCAGLIQGSGKAIAMYYALAAEHRAVFDRRLPADVPESQHLFLWIQVPTKIRNILHLDLPHPSCCCCYVVAYKVSISDVNQHRTHSRISEWFIYHGCVEQHKIKRLNGRITESSRYWLLTIWKYPAASVNVALSNTSFYRCSQRGTDEQLQSTTGATLHLPYLTCTQALIRGCRLPERRGSDNTRWAEHTIGAWSYLNPQAPVETHRILYLVSSRVQNQNSQLAPDIRVGDNILNKW